MGTTPTVLWFYGFMEGGDSAQAAATFSREARRESLRIHHPPSRSILPLPHLSVLPFSFPRSCFIPLEDDFHHLTLPPPPNPLSSLFCCCARIGENSPHLGFPSSPSLPPSNPLTNPLPPLPQAMSDARLPLSHRDTCAHLLIPLNACRVNTYYLPYKCKHERHGYEECQWLAYQQRVQMKKDGKV